MNDLYGTEERAYKDKLEKFDARFSELITELNWKRTEKLKKDVLLGGKEEPRPLKHIDDMTTFEVIELGDKTQTQGKESLLRTKRLVEEARETGAHTALTLDAQTHQIGKIHDEMREIESTLKRADRMIRGFVRRHATDKVTRMFMCLIFCAIVFLIVWKAVGKSSAPDINTPDVLPHNIPTAS
eukprot:GILJ01014633.1.p1 GENE.GILJ01014633.1~~GILJ01014633.1.p1  ORF type:complete len:191 (-),score=34.12 GILJ01014633.1:238-789(-)